MTTATFTGSETLYSKKGESLQTSMTDAAAIGILRAAAVKSDFAQDLIRSYDRYGKASGGQRYWVHKLSADQKAQEIIATLPVQREVFANIASLLQAGGQSLKHATLTFALGRNQQYLLSLCGQRSKYPGAVHFTRGEKYMGRIDPNGEFTDRACGEEEYSFLDALNADPAGYAAAYGQKTGTCCFCHRQLTDPRSVNAGYGRVCAKNFHMPY